MVKLSVGMVLVVASVLGWTGGALADNYMSRYSFSYDWNDSHQFQRSGYAADNFVGDVKSGRLKLNGADGNVIVLYNLLGPYSGIITDAWRAYWAGKATPTQKRYLSIVNNQNEVLHTWVNTSYANKLRGLDVTQYDPYRPLQHSTGPYTGSLAR
jgi:hypothetical protein